MKINSPYSSWHEIIFREPQGSTLGILLLNIFLIDLFFIIKDFDIASSADDNTSYVLANNMNGTFRSIEEASTKLFKWFSDSLLVKKVILINVIY